MDSKWLKYAEFFGAFVGIVSVGTLVFGLVAFGMIEAEYHLYKLSEHFDLTEWIK